MAAERIVGIFASRGTTARAARVGLVIVAYVSVVAAAALLPLLFTRNPFGKPTPELQAYRLALWLVWLAVLVESMRNQAASRLWKLILAYTLGAQIWAFGYLPNSIVWSWANLLSTIYLAIFIHLVLAFPSGRLEARADRLVVGFYYAIIGGFSVLVAVVSQLPVEASCTPSCYQNVLAIWPNAEATAFLVVADVVIPVLASPLIIVRLWRHWRAGSWIDRQALLPLLIAVPLVVAAAALDFLGERFEIRPLTGFFTSSLQPLPQFVVPIAFLLGMLRLRLNRGRIADLVLELGRGLPVGGLREVLARTLGDPTLEVAFAAPSGNGYVDLDGREIALPADPSARAVTRLARDGELLAVLIHDPRIDDQDAGLVQAAGTAARLALENERLTALVRAQLEEVRASRSRLVDASDAERRRIERDLHDGAQQRLLALAMRLQVAKETAAGSTALLEEATTELQAAIREVRDIARGLHPPILTESGLGAAVEALAERAPVPVSVTVPATRYRDALETAAYFMVAEALTNVARHANAQRADVVAMDTDGSLVVTVRDDGRGGADVKAGSGLSGLGDRIAAIGGTLSITSPAGEGTTVTAVMPIR